MRCLVFGEFGGKLKLGSELRYLVMELMCHGSEPVYPSLVSFLRDGKILHKWGLERIRKINIAGNSIILQGTLGTAQLAYVHPKSDYF